MREATMLAVALTVISATIARAEDWCGYTAAAKSMIECGYSSVAECESATGKSGMCFIDPDYALNLNRAAPTTVMPAIAVKPNAGRG